MDDTKKLIERYKRELMEYSRSVQPAPKPRLEFPNMTVEEPSIPAPTTEPPKSASPVEPTPSEDELQRAPQIIGYGGEDIMAQFNDIFGEQPAEDEYAKQPEPYGGVSTVTPEQAEELDDIPESGEFPEEQLGKRDFTSEVPTRNDPEDVRPLEQSGEAVPIPDERDYASLEEFTEVNSRRGTARFRTFTARGAFPVVGARIVISHEIGGKPYIFYTLTTDISGQTPEIMLPAPPKELSETPDSKVTPYAAYNAEITAEGYNDVLITNMPIFEGVLSNQNVALVPAMGQPAQVITESEPDLNGGA